MTTPGIAFESKANTVVDASNTPLFVGKGMKISGRIESITGDPTQRLVIQGEVHGDILTDGILDIAEHAVVHATSKIDCGEIIVSGRLTGDKEKVTVRANVLTLAPTGDVSVETLQLPPGGLEQSRGGVLNARLDMSAEFVREIAPATTAKPVEQQTPPMQSMAAPVANAVKAAPTSVPAYLARSSASASAPASKTPFGDAESAKVVSLGASSASEPYKGEDLPSDPKPGMKVAA